MSKRQSILFHTQRILLTHITLSCYNLTKKQADSYMINETDPSNPSGLHVYIAPQPFYKKPFMIPAVIFVLLILAYVFRWNYTVTQTVNNSSVHYKILHKEDRWTGNRWLEIYGYDSDGVRSGDQLACLPNGIEAKGKQEDDVYNRRDGATAIWWLLFIADAVWLGIEIKRAL